MKHNFDHLNVITKYITLFYVQPIRLNLKKERREMKPTLLYQFHLFRRLYANILEKAWIFCIFNEHFATFIGKY